MRSADSFLKRCDLLMGGKHPRDILQAALHVIEDPARWGQYTQDASGRLVAHHDPAAVRWCVEGAISISCNSFGIVPPYFMILLDDLLHEEFGFDWNVPRFEQYYHHDCVVGLLKRAITKVPEGRVW